MPTWPDHVRHASTDAAPITRASNKAVLPSVHVWINQQKIRAGQTPILLFESQQHLVSELEVAVDEGQKCFVTSNSKTLVENLQWLWPDRFGSGRLGSPNHLDTVSSEEVQGFISDPATRIRDYDVVLTSPSLGTGVDISLVTIANWLTWSSASSSPHESLRDRSALARVRDPGAIEVWITARRWNYETEFEIVREDIMRQSLFKNVLKGYTAEGAPQYASTDPFINMAALTTPATAPRRTISANISSSRAAAGLRAPVGHEDEDRSAYRDRSPARRQTASRPAPQGGAAPGRADAEARLRRGARGAGRQ